MRIDERSAPADSSRNPASKQSKEPQPTGGGPVLQSGKPPSQVAADEEARKKADRKALLISGGIWLAGSVAGGLTNWGLNKVAPTYGRAGEPVVNITTGVLQSPGGRFQENMVSPLRARVWSFAATKPVDNGTPVGKVVYPKLLEEVVTANIMRNKLNGWQVGQLENLAAYTRTLEMVCHGARECLKANDLEGASRRLAAALVHDRTFWGELNPTSTEIYELVYAGLYPYFARFDEAKRKQLQAMVESEAVRLDPKDHGLKDYVNAIMIGLTTNQKPAELPWKVASEPTAELAGLLVANQDGSPTQTRQLLDQYFESLVAGKGWLERLKICRQRRRVTKAVVKEVEAFEKELGRGVTLDELWKVILRALKIDTGKQLENQVSMLSLGMFAGFGAASGLANQQLAKHVSAGAMTGLNAVVFALVGYAMGAAGSFFSDKFGAAGRALGFGGLKNVTIGKGIERELRDNLLKILAVDRRMDGGRVSFISYQYFVQDQMGNAEDALKRGKIEQAAAFIGNTAWESRVMYYEYSPFMETMRLLFTRIGPQFDGLTTAQRDELIEKATACASQHGANKWDMDNYVRPFIVSMLTENVKLKDAPAPQPAPRFA